MTSFDPTAQYGAPPSGTTSTANQPQPIGVNPGYAPPVTNADVPPPGAAPGAMGPFNTPQTSLGTAPAKRVYMDGDEWGPAHSPHNDVIALQNEMVAAGLLDPTIIHKGVWDANSAAAYKIVLANANVYGASAPDMLRALVTNAPAKAKGAGSPYPITNPVDTKAAYETAAGNLTGGALPQGENAFTDWYNSQQAEAANAYRNAPSGAAYTEKPGIDAAAKSYILAHNQQDVVNYDMALRTMQFRQALAEL